MRDGPRIRSYGAHPQGLKNGFSVRFGEGDDAALVVGVLDENGGVHIDIPFNQTKWTWFQLRWAALQVVKNMEEDADLYLV